MNTDQFTREFSEIGMSDVASVGGKNSSLGELWKHLSPTGVNVLDGFATTAAAYRRFLKENDLENRLRNILSGFDPENTAELQDRGDKARTAIMDTPLPEELTDAFLLGLSSNGIGKLGSVAQKLLTEANCSVRITRAKTDTAPSRLKIFIGFNNTPGSLEGPLNRKTVKTINRFGKYNKHGHPRTFKSDSAAGL